MGPVSLRPNRVDFREVKLHSHLERNAVDRQKTTLPTDEMKLGLLKKFLIFTETADSL